jgi:hypothetical protein
MSWSVKAVGRASAVAEKLALNFAQIQCSEPEETIKNRVAEAVAAALGAFPRDKAVLVEASGHQSEQVNTLNVKIDPLWGFVD